MILPFLLLITEVRNSSTIVNEFILVGFTDDPWLQVALFMVFLMIYVITLMGNLGMILLIKIDPQLHTPMYFFLSHLSFCDVCYSSAIAPKMLVNFLRENKAISFIGCAAQSYIFGSFLDAECFLLAAMAYDRCVAICKPLLYNVTMSRLLCVSLVVGAYTIGLVDSLVHTYFAFRLSFCSSNVINHFFCDIPALLVLSCSNTWLNELLLFIIVSFLEMSTTLSILVSYLYIFITIIKTRSAEGKRKAFSTCASHLLCLTIFHGTLLFMYTRPSSSYSMDTDKMASVFYTMVIPMLNPLIYSLRNKDVKDALRRVMSRKCFPSFLH
uniref:Olfactory receptor n=1 Tax=Pelusios castaneus TaxID=367368 RepID=A0A8C8SPZ8_9SAUR